MSFVVLILAAGLAALPRDPYEAAALGSAILHGPNLGAHAAALAQLSEARALRKVTSAETLATGAADAWPRSS